MTCSVGLYARYFLATPVCPAFAEAASPRQAKHSCLLGDPFSERRKVGAQTRGPTLQFIFQSL
jgi:hypothetical protein